MTSSISYPYLRPNANRVTASEWRVASTGYAGPLVPDLPGWDYSTNLAVAVQLDVELLGILADCGIGGRSRLGGLISWRAEKTSLRGSSTVEVLGSGINTLGLDLLGAELGGRLELEARVVLLDPDGGGELSPRLVGSILWSEKRSIRLEGVADRFPIELRDFTKAGLRGAGGAWVLHWDCRDPEWSASACLRLWINSQHPVADVLTCDSPDPNVMSLLRHDLTRQLVEEAIENEELTDSEWPPGSLGAALLERLRGVFPGLSLEDCRSMRRDRREDFESSIQAATSMLRGLA